MAAVLWAGRRVRWSRTRRRLRSGTLDGVRARNVEIRVPTNARPGSDLVVVHRGDAPRRPIGRSSMAIPITTPARTLIDLAGDWRIIGCSAAPRTWFRRDLVDARTALARLDALGGLGSAGQGRLRRLLEARRCAAGAGVGARGHRCGGSSCERAFPARRGSIWVHVSAGRLPPRLRVARPKIGARVRGVTASTATTIAFGQGPRPLADVVAAGWRVVPVTWRRAETIRTRVVALAAGTLAAAA